MRIIGYIEHPGIKISVFKLDDRFSVKFEMGQYEQTYKFRGSKDLDGLEELKRLIDNIFIASVEKEFRRMQHNTHLAMERFYRSRSEEDEFDEII